MINCGMVVALGTDFNPNAHCLSMPMVMHLACVNLKMTLNEVRAKVAAEILCLKKAKDVILTERSNIAWHQALAAATINAAHSIGRGASHGSLQVFHFYREYRSRCFFLQGRKGCGHVGSWRETLGTPGLSGLAFFVHDMFSCCRFSNLVIVCFFAAWVEGCDQTCGEKGNRCGLVWNPGA